MFNLFVSTFYYSLVYSTHGPDTQTTDQNPDEQRRQDCLRVLCVHYIKKLDLVTDGDGFVYRYLITYVDRDVDNDDRDDKYHWDY